MHPAPRLDVAPPLLAQPASLGRVVEEYVATSSPVGSRVLVERAGFDVSASTVRAELAELERLGLLTHPHTSAGRTPTEAGYRVYVDGLLARKEPRPAAFALGQLAGPIVVAVAAADGTRHGVGPSLLAVALLLVGAWALWRPQPVR